MSGTNVVDGIKGIVPSFGVTSYFDTSYTSRAIHIARVYPIFIVAVKKGDTSSRFVFKNKLVTSSDREPPTNLNINVSEYVGNKGATTFTVPITSWTVQEYNDVSVYVIPALSNADTAFPDDPSTVSAPYVVTGTGTTFADLGDQQITTVSKTDGTISTYYDKASNTWRTITRNTYYFRLMVKDEGGYVRHTTTSGVKVGDFVVPTFSNPGFTLANVPGSSTFNSDSDYKATVSWNASDWNTYKIYFVVQESSDSTAYNTPWDYGNIAEYNFVDDTDGGSSNTTYEVTRYYKGGTWYVLKRDTYKIKMYIRDAGPNVTEVTGKNSSDNSTGLSITFLVGDYAPPIFSSVSSITRSDPIFISGNSYYCKLDTACTTADTYSNHKVHFFAFYDDSAGNNTLTDAQAYAIVSSGNFSGVSTSFRYTSSDYGSGSQSSTISDIRGYIYSKTTIAGKTFVGGRTYRTFFVAVDRFSNYKVHTSGEVYIPYLTTPIITLTPPTSRAVSNGSYTPIALTISGLDGGRNINLKTYIITSSSTQVNEKLISDNGTLHASVTNQSIDRYLTFLPEGYTLYFYWFAEDPTYSFMKSSNENNPASGRPIPTLTIPWVSPTVTIQKVTEYKTTFSYNVIGIEETSSEFKLVYGFASPYTVSAALTGSYIGTNQYRAVVGPIQENSYGAYSVINKPTLLAKSRQTNLNGDNDSANVNETFSNDGLGVGATIGTMTITNLTYNSFTVSVPFTLSGGFTAVARIEGVIGTQKPTQDNVTANPTTLAFSSLAAGTSYTASVYVYGYYRNYTTTPMLQLDTAQVSSAYTIAATTLGVLTYTSQSTQDSINSTRSFSVTTSVNVATNTYRQLVVTNTSTAGMTQSTGFIEKGGAGQSVEISLNNDTFINGGTFSWTLSVKLTDNSTVTNPSQVTSSTSGASTFTLSYVPSTLTASVVSVVDSTRTLNVTSSVTLRTSTRVLKVCAANTSSPVLKENTFSNIGAGSTNMNIVLSETTFQDGGTFAWHVSATDSNGTATNPASTTATNFSLAALSSTLSASLKSVDDTSRLLTLDTNVTLRAYIVQIIVKNSGGAVLLTGNYSSTYTAGAQTPSITLSGATLDAGGTNFIWEANAKVKINNVETTLTTQTGTFNILANDTTPPVITITGVTPGLKSVRIQGTSNDSQSSYTVYVFCSTIQYTQFSSAVLEQLGVFKSTQQASGVQYSIDVSRSVTDNNTNLADGTSYYYYVVAIDSRGNISYNPVTGTTFTTVTPDTSGPILSTFPYVYSLDRVIGVDPFTIINDEGSFKGIVFASESNSYTTSGTNVTSGITYENIHVNSGSYYASKGYTFSGGSGTFLITPPSTFQYKIDNELFRVNVSSYVYIVVVDQANNRNVQRSDQRRPYDSVAPAITANISQTNFIDIIPSPTMFELLGEPTSELYGDETKPYKTIYFISPNSNYPTSQLSYNNLHTDSTNYVTNNAKKSSFIGMENYLPSFYLTYTIENNIITSGVSYYGYGVLIDVNNNKKLYKSTYPYVNIKDNTLDLIFVSKANTPRILSPYTEGKFTLTFKIPPSNPSYPQQLQYRFIFLYKSKVVKQLNTPSLLQSNNAHSIDIIYWNGIALGEPHEWIMQQNGFHTEMPTFPMQLGSTQNGMFIPTVL
jgi:hypothetical protein